MDFKRRNPALDAHFARIRKIPDLAPVDLAEIDAAVVASLEPDASAEAIALGRRSRERLVLAYQRLAIYWSRRIRTPIALDPMDVLQEATLGLMHASRKYDPRKGAKFSTYARMWIHAYVNGYVMSRSSVQRSALGRDMYATIVDAAVSLTREGEDVTPQRVADRTGLDIDFVAHMLNATTGTYEVSLDAHVGSDETMTRGDMIRSMDSSPEDRADARVRLEKVLSVARSFAESLSDRDADILYRRVLAEDPVTLEVLGAQYAVSKERVRQVEVKLRARLHAELGASLSEAV